MVASTSGARFIGREATPTANVNYLGLARHTGVMRLAQLNVGRLRAPMDDPLIDDFRTNLERVNALAETSPGYVWRLQDDSGDATSIKVFDDDLDIVNDRHPIGPAQGRSDGGTTTTTELGDRL